MDKAVETLLEHFKDEEVKREFYKFFREVFDIYEMISPDAFLRPYINDIENFAEMYRVVLHELLHLRYPNLGKMFTRLLNSYLRKERT